MATHEPGVGEGGRDIRVSRHDPDLMLLVPVHRIAFSQRAVGGVRVPKEIRREEGWEGPLGHRRVHAWIVIGWTSSGKRSPSLVSSRPPQADEFSTRETSILI